jgi:hypothetical protein
VLQLPGGIGQDSADKQQSRADLSLNEAVEAYTGKHADRKGKCTPLKQYSLVTIKRAVDERVILIEVKTKTPWRRKDEESEELPGSKSVVCMERYVRNLGDPKAPHKGGEGKTNERR